MSDRAPISIQYLMYMNRSERSVYIGSGRYQKIVARQVIWDMLDFLVDKSNFPINELIDDCRSIWGDAQFETAFEHDVLRAMIADQMVTDNLANDNFVTVPDPLTGRVHVSISCPVWRMHRKTKQGRLVLPRIEEHSDLATVIQYEDSYRSFLSSRLSSYRAT